MVMRSKKGKLTIFKKLLDIIKIFSDDIKMEFGLDKYANATFIKGKLTKTSNIVFNQDTAI